MKLEKIDTNFAVGEVNADGMKAYNIYTTPFKIYGLYDCKEGSYTRMPYEVAERVNDGVKWLHTNTAGGRLRFKTDSRRIALRYILPDVCLLPHMPATGVSCIRLPSAPPSTQSTCFLAQPYAYRSGSSGIL